MRMAGKKEGPGLLEQDGAESVQTTKHEERIPHGGATVKRRANWLKDFHVRSKLTSAEIVELVRPLCKGFDKPLLAKCENPEKYGVQISNKVIRYLKEWEKKHDRHT